MWSFIVSWNRAVATNYWWISPEVLNWFIENTAGASITFEVSKLPQKILESRSPEMPFPAFYYYLNIHLQMFTHIMLYAINKVSVEGESSFVMPHLQYLWINNNYYWLFLLKVALYMYIHTLDHVIIILYWSTRIFP